MIKCADQSPRVCKDNSIRWYEGDTFKIEFNLDLTDSNGKALPVEETDVFTMTIVNKKNEEVHVIEATGTDVIVFEMTEELNEIFTKGQYFYNIVMDGEYRTTIVDRNKMVVE